MQNHQDRLRTAVVAALAVLTSLVVVSPASAAKPGVIGCGSTITSSVTLAADIGPCVRGGLVIGADDVTLDLGGHRVFGKSRTGDGIGIAVPGHTGVTIRNGTVAQFDAGVVIDGGSGNLVEAITANFNQGGARGDFGDGILISDSSGNTVQSNNVTNNGPFSGISLLGVTEDNEILSNVVASNGVPATGNDGIRVEGPGAAGNLVQGNTVTGSTLDGIAVFRGVAVPGGPSLNNENRIIANTVTANGFGHLGARPGDGIRVFPGPMDTVIQSNSVRDNAGNGIIVANGSTSNDILTNTAIGNARAAALFDLNDGHQTCDANVWSGNTFETANQSCIS